MNSDELIFLGKIIKSQGFDGGLVLALEGSYSEEIEDMESVFIEIDGIPVPFFVASSSLSGRLLSIRFDDYDTKDKASEFIGCKLYTDSKYISNILAPPVPNFIIGYKLYSNNKEEIGVISELVSYPMQHMLLIEGKSGAEILVPFHDDWLINIDKKRKVVVMDLPEGILSLND